MSIRSLVLFILTIILLLAMFVGFYGHSPIGHMTWQQAAGLHTWYMPLIYVAAFIGCFVWPIVDIIRTSRRNKYITDLANTKSH